MDTGLRFDRDVDVVVQNPLAGFLMEGMNDKQRFSEA